MSLSSLNNYIQPSRASVLHDKDTMPPDRQLITWLSRKFAGGRVMGTWDEYLADKEEGNVILETVNPDCPDPLTLDNVYPGLKEMWG
jgi:hypothetical protein